MSMSSVEAFAAAQAKYAQTFETHLENGVNFISRDVYIEPGVVIAPGATILPGTILRGATVIEAGCVVGPNSLLENTTLGEGCTAEQCVLIGQQYPAGTAVPPFTHRA